MQSSARLFAPAILLLALVPAWASAGDRIRWEPGPPAVGFRHSASVPGGDPSALPYLVADLRGQTVSFAPADTALFVVFLAGERELAGFRHLLRASGVSALLACADAFPFSSAVPAPATFDLAAHRLEVGLNGRVEVHADEGRHPGKDRLAVMNAAGDILSVRPLWRAAAMPPDLVIARP